MTWLFHISCAFSINCDICPRMKPMYFTYLLRCFSYIAISREVYLIKSILVSELRYYVQNEK